MADILSQEEIDALLQAVDDDEDGAELVASEAHKKPKLPEDRQIIIYDFKRPNRVVLNSLSIPENNAFIST